MSKYEIERVLMGMGSDAIKHGRRSIRAERSLDEIVGEREMELMENGSYEQWKTRCLEEEMQHRYEIGRKVLDKVCELRKGNVVSKNIFKAVVLQQMSPQTVAVQYGTTRNNVDQIVSRVNGWLRKDGRRIFRRLYDEAA